MNKDRRKAITELSAELENLRDDIDNLISRIEGIRDDEQEYYDNMPESFQQGEKGQAAEAAVSALDEASGALQEVDFDSILNYLDEATA